MAEFSAFRGEGKELKRRWQRTIHKALPFHLAIGPKRLDDLHLYTSTVEREISQTNVSPRLNRSTTTRRRIREMGPKQSETAENEPAMTEWGSAAAGGVEVRGRYSVEESQEIKKV